ncbi:MAG: alkyl hydroperoxide reductase [Phycisphaerae bacterium SM23_33]|nr:MAG: alkyl hydroperoxide reductase [Phycisphaerae bacterium SM23_33]
MSRYEGKVAAPEFPAGLEWLNTDKPLSLRALRGKVVLLDFWTYCCINCMHVVADLKRLEAKYPSELVVVGVHSGKFTTEKETDNIRQAVLRYGIAHPVVNDADMAVWQQYGVRAWPTLVLIDPAGKVVTAVSGEGAYDAFNELIGEVARIFESKGLLDRRPLKRKLERLRSDSPLSFPGKVLADEASGRLFLADSNHNRIVVTDLEGRLQHVIGTGRTGADDGPFDRATFNHPQGLALAGGDLYVADTENHLIRLVDLGKRTVTTVAGTGEQARMFDAAGPGETTALNSPWALAAHGEHLYIAMAGSHQLWRMDLRSHSVEPYAGSGREGRIDGPLGRAALAQPSGLTTDGRRLYFADSEVSAIRSADLPAADAAGKVETIVGGELFDFGDRDGRGLEVRLQHPLGVVWHAGVLYVADTYNNKIKLLNPADRSCRSFLGTGEAGLADGDRPSFDEPGGISAAGGKLYVADTNNHVIRVADLNTRRVETLHIKGLGKPSPAPGREGVSP